MCLPLAMLGRDRDGNKGVTATVTARDRHQSQSPPGCTSQHRKSQAPFNAVSACCLKSQLPYDTDTGTEAGYSQSCLKMRRLPHCQKSAVLAEDFVLLCAPLSLQPQVSPGSGLLSGLEGVWGPDWAGILRNLLVLRSCLTPQPCWCSHTLLVLLVPSEPQPWSPLSTTSACPQPQCHLAAPWHRAQLFPSPIQPSHHCTLLNLSPTTPDSTSHHFPTSWPFFPQLTHFTPHCTLEPFRGGTRRSFLPMKALQRQQDPVLGAPSKWHTQQRTPCILLGNTQISLPPGQAVFRRILPFQVE